MTLKFGKYVVENEIGRGGFGRVYCALDADMKRRVAIKVLICESDADLLSRFQAEAGTTANLAHRNIVTVYEFAHQDGLPYLVMELLDGRTLLEIIGPPAATLPILEKVEIMYQVAEGLQHAHSRGVIHRDIKPGNIMVQPDGKVKIMDFGIARVMHGDAMRRTRAGDLIGTVSYMAPEMFHNHEPDKKTDIFAYGALYYELLAGEHPFEAKDPYTAMNRIMNDDPLPLRHKLATCPEGLEILVQHLLMKDRETRFDELNDIIFETEPILRQLRQERAAALAKEIAPLLNTGDYERAYPWVKQILDLDPGQKEARAWRDQIRKRSNWQRADRLRRQGLEYMSALRFKEAVTCFESALHLDSDKAELLPLLEEARAGVERVRRSLELIADARAERQRGHIEEAFSKASEAIELDPANQDAASLRDSLRKQIRELQMAARLARSEDLCRKGAFDDALACLDELESDLQSHPDVVKLRGRLADERKEAERRRRGVEFEHDLQKAKDVLEALHFEHARDLAESLCFRYPEQAAGFQFRNEARDCLERERRIQALAAISQNARELIGGRRFDEARAVIAEGLQSYPGEPNLKDLAKTVESLAEAQQRLLTIQRVLERADVLMGEDSLDRALDLVDKAVAQVGDDPTLLEWQRSLRQKRDRQIYALNLEKAVAEAQSIVEAGQPRRALLLLEGAAADFGGEPKFEAFLRDTREKARQEDEREFVEQTLRRIRSFEAEERYQEGLHEVERALARCLDKRELESAAQRLRKAASEQKRDLVLREHAGQIKAALAVEDWTQASQRLAAAKREFPRHELLTELAATIHEGRRRTDLRSLEAKVCEALDREDFKGAEVQLTTAQTAFSRDPAWISLKQQLLHRREYRSELSRAEEACAKQDLVKAKNILENLRKNAPDSRASGLYKIVCEELRRLEAEERSKRASAEDLDRRSREAIERGKVQAQREAEEQAQKERENAVAACETAIAEMVAIEDFAAAIARLTRFETEWGESAATRAEKERLRRAFDLQREEAKEKARIEAEEALLRQREEDLRQLRKEISDALNLSDYACALRHLRHAAKRFPEIAEFGAQQETVLREQKHRKADDLERARRNASEQTRKKREVAISEGRQKAAALAREGNLSAAVAVLERLGRQYPNSSELRGELEAASRELLYQRKIQERSGALGNEPGRNGRAQQLEKLGRNAVTLFRQGEFSGAFAVLKQLIRSRK